MQKDIKPEPFKRQNSIHSSIGSIRSMDDFLDELSYSKAIQQMRGNIVARFSHLRNVRGDGNCYYRAVIYGYMERLIFKGPAALEEFIHMLACTDPHSYYDMSKEPETIAPKMEPKIRDIIKALSDKGHRTALEILFRNFNESDEFDHAAMCWLRRILFNFMNRNRGLIAGGMTFSAYVQKVKNMSYDEYLDTVVLKLGENAAELVLIAVPLVLRINIDVLSLNPKEEKAPKVIPIVSYLGTHKDIQTSGESKELDFTAEKITVLHIPGHYRLVHSAEETKIHPDLGQVGAREIPKCELCEKVIREHEDSGVKKLARKILHGGCYVDNIIKQAGGRIPLTKREENEPEMKRICPITNRDVRIEDLEAWFGTRDEYHRTMSRLQEHEVSCRREQAMNRIFGNLDDFIAPCCKSSHGRNKAIKNLGPCLISNGRYMAIYTCHICEMQILPAGAEKMFCKSAVESYIRNFCGVCSKFLPEPALRCNKRGHSICEGCRGKGCAVCASIESGLDYCRMAGQNHMLKRQLAKEVYGEAYEGENTEGKTVLIRQVPVSKEYSWHIESVKHKGKLKELMGDKNVLGFIEYINDAEDQDRFQYFVYEGCNNNENGEQARTLEEYLAQQLGAKLTEGEARAFVKQIVSGCAYLHSKGIIHQDLQPKNILMYYPEGGKGETKILKIGGYSSARTDDEQRSRKEFFTDYDSPQIRKGAECTSGTDVYSIGVLTYYMLCGKVMFASQEELERGEYLLDGHLSEKCADFVIACVQENENDRDKASSLGKHPWITHDKSTGGTTNNPKSWKLSTKNRIKRRIPPLEVIIHVDPPEEQHGCWLCSLFAAIILCFCYVFCCKCFYRSR
ncbi:MAG: protein kinase [Candidatus Pacebacteria bacterium]|nr:protein kinase [Candidatus Paceibacterota bacterium]